jgi:hypothetical protein
MVGCGVWFRMTQRTPGEREALRRHREMARVEREMLESVTKLAGQLEQTAARIDRHFDERVQALECLIRTADERIAQLALADGPAGANEVPDLDREVPPETTKPGGRVGEKTAIAEPSPAAAVLHGQAGGFQPRIVAEATANAAGIVPNDTPQAKAAGPALPETAIVEVDAPSVDIGELRSRVRALASDGRRPMDIAESLGISLGEVELMLGLDQFAPAAT